MQSTKMEFTLPPEVAFDAERFKAAMTERFGANHRMVMKKRSIDARSRQVVVRIQVEERVAEQRVPTAEYRTVSANAPRVLIIGAGPAGLFAALRLLETGVKPIILERGKDVQARRRDLAAINREHIVNPDSNYCFGEGGAGTYSDGKLYTRSNKRGDINRILATMVAHGAAEEILFDAHPHIGTNKLPVLIQAIRSTILSAGGEIHFNSCVTELRVEGKRVKGVTLRNGDHMDGDAVILATGHSARDVFAMLAKQGILIEAKPFALGVRVEHPQLLIDQVQYHCQGARSMYLPAASYALVTQVKEGRDERGVFSFCMCPGGFIVPAATSPGEIVVNGMSPSRRDSKFANSGIVVAVSLEDVGKSGHSGPLAAMQFQASVEQAAFRAGGGTQAAPAQRLIDFVEGKESISLPDCSYQPGLTPADLQAVVPRFAGTALRQAFRDFGKKIKGYLTEEAVVLATESRTSSPVRIPRDPGTLLHPQFENLFPCGEGAGYAGGIMSAAMDGERCAEAFLQQKGIAYISATA